MILALWIALILTWLWIAVINNVHAKNADTLARYTRAVANEIANIKKGLKQ